MAVTKTITVRTVSGEKFDRIVDYELGEKPEPELVAVDDLQRPSDSEIPF